MTTNHDHADDCECCHSDRAAFLRKLEEQIKRFGWSVLGTESDFDGRVRPLTYTIGLSDRGQPELMVFGLPMSVAQEILNSLAFTLGDGPFPLDTPLEGYGNLPLVLKPVAAAPAADFIVQANNRAGRELPAVQIFWPDPKGLFPWDAGFDSKFEGWQPMLFNAMQ